MKITFKTGFFILLATAFAYAGFYYFFAYPVVGLNETTTLRVVEITSAVVFPLLVGYFIAKNRSDQFQRATFAILVLGIAILITNVIKIDLREISAAKNIRNNAIAAMTGQDAKLPVSSESAVVNALNELVIATQEQNQLLLRSEERIRELYPKTIVLEMFVDPTLLKQARESLSEIEVLTDARVITGKNWYRERMRLVEQLESKYKISLDAARRGTETGWTNTEKFFIPVQNQMQKIVETLKEIHKFAEEQQGTAEIKNGQVLLGTGIAVQKFNTLSAQLNEQTKKLRELETELKEHADNAIDTIKSQGKLKGEKQ